MESLAPHVDALLFDLDGTLIDTDDAAVRALARRLRPLVGRGAAGLARRLIMGVETPGNSVITLLDRLGLDGPVMTLKERLRDREDKEPRFDLVPGVEQLLQGLAGSYPIALVTTRSSATITAFLAQYPAIAAVVTTSCGLQDTRRLKPHPEPVRTAARRLGRPARTLPDGR